MASGAGYGLEISPQFFLDGGYDTGSHARVSADVQDRLFVYFNSTDVYDGLFQPGPLFAIDAEDGSLRDDFDAVTTGSVYGITFDRQGRILADGRFRDYYEVRRYLPDGRLDPLPNDLRTPDPSDNKPSPALSPHKS
jgi:hypothetical protein